MKDQLLLSVVKGNNVDTRLISPFPRHPTRKMSSLSGSYTMNQTVEEGLQDRKEWSGRQQGGEALTMRLWIQTQVEQQTPAKTSTRKHDEKQRKRRRLRRIRGS